MDDKPKDEDFVFYSHPPFGIPYWDEQEELSQLKQREVLMIEKIKNLEAECSTKSKEIEWQETQIRELRKQAEPAWEKMGWLSKSICILCGILLVKTLFNPVSHRLSPDIGNEWDGYERVGQVVGFHYEKRTWWGFRKRIYDSIQFVPDHGPQYYDEKAKKWRDIPEQAWGVASVDDRVMEVDNRGWHEQ